MDVHVEPQLDTALAEIQYTSGPTGMPKGVKHTHGNLAATARAGRTHMGYGSHTVFTTVVPCFHAVGMNAATTPAFVHGVTNRFLPQCNPRTALQTLAAERVTDAMLIPTERIDLVGARHRGVRRLGLRVAQRRRLAHADGAHRGRRSRPRL